MKRFNDVLVYVSADAHDDPAVARAGELARRTGARLTLADAIEPMSGWVERRLRAVVADPATVLREDRQRRLDEMARPLRESGLDVKACVLEGPAAEALLARIEAAGHDLVMKTARGAPPSGVGAALGLPDYGDVAIQLMRAAPVPVWVVGREHAGPYRRVLAAIAPTSRDRSRDALSARVLELGRAMAEVDGAELHVVHAWSAFGEQLIVSRPGGAREAAHYAELSEREARCQLGRALRPLGRRVDHPAVHLRKGLPEHVIPQVHGEVGADLLVIGTVGRSGVTGWLVGNTAEKVLQVTPASLLAVKPDVEAAGPALAAAAGLG